MTNSFEQHPLTEYEYQILLPKMIAGLEKRIGEDNAITNKQMRAGFEKQNIKVSDARIRKLINVIRHNDWIPGLIASSKGYWVERDKKRLLEYAQSIEHRAASEYALAKKVRSWVTSAK